jgi:DNA-binding MarR family transcriptional regulator
VDDISRVRRFNRRWTEILGLLDQGLLATDHSLTEARVIFELAHGERTERMALRRRLGMDDSFLTRVLRGLEADGLVAVSPSTVDGRRRDLVLTEHGRAAFAELDRRSNEQVAGLLAPLSTDQRRLLGDSMTVITNLLDPPPGGPHDRHPRPRERRSRLGDRAPRRDLRRRVRLVDRLRGARRPHRRRLLGDPQPSRERAWIAEVDGVACGLRVLRRA